MGSKRKDGLVWDGRGNRPSLLSGAGGQGRLQMQVAWRNLAWQGEGIPS